MNGEVKLHTLRRLRRHLPMNGEDQLLSWGGWFARQAAPLARPDAIVRVAQHERHRRRPDHAVVLAHHAALAALLMLDDYGALQDRSNSYLLAVDDGIEAAADFVVGGRDDGGQRDE